MDIENVVVLHRVVLGFVTRQVLGFYFPLAAQSDEIAAIDDFCTDACGRCSP